MFKHHSRGLDYNKVHKIHEAADYMEIITAA